MWRRLAGHSALARNDKAEAKPDDISQATQCDSRRLSGGAAGYLSASYLKETLILAR